MKLKSTFAALAGALLIAGSSYANNQSECPSISAIKAEGLNQVQEIMPGTYFAYNISTYNTEETWGFAIAPIGSDSPESALETGNEILADITSEGTPGTQDGYAYCQYETADPSIAAVAFKDNVGHLSVMKIKQFIH